MLPGIFLAYKWRTSRQDCTSIAQSLSPESLEAGRVAGVSELVMMKLIIQELLVVKLILSQLVSS